jgi:hypothetical protein
MDTFYNSRIKDRSAEEILQTLSDYPAQVPYEGASANTLLMAAQIRTAERQIESQSKLTTSLAVEVSALTESINKASADSGALGRKIVYLTFALVAVGLIQALATAWPYLAWWFARR